MFSPVQEPFFSLVWLWLFFFRIASKCRFFFFSFLFLFLPNYVTFELEDPSLFCFLFTVSLGVLLLHPTVVLGTFSGLVSSFLPTYCACPCLLIFLSFVFFLFYLNRTISFKFSSFSSCVTYLEFQRLQSKVNRTHCFVPEAGRTVTWEHWQSCSPHVS